MSAYVEMDEDEEIIEFLYEDGHWEWDDKEGGLVFISHKIAEEEPPLLQQILVHTTFKQDIDLIEQQKYKKRYQRKPVGDDDVVRLQDVKDIVIYTTPLALLSKSIINILHQRAMERLLRALILYIQYYLQVSDEIETRTLNATNMIRTKKTDEIEFRFRENLHDLRLLIAKEYCVLILGGSCYKNYHHMGADKNRASFTKADELFYEAFIRISVEIVYIALGRKAYKQIDLEVNRIFRSENFNLAEREYKSNTSLNTIEENIFLGRCLKHRSHALNEHSPLFEECKWLRDVDFTTMGLGVIKYPILNERQIYFERALTLPEMELQKHDISLGIVGVERRRFDILLKEVKEEPGELNAQRSNTSLISLSRKKKELSNAHVSLKNSSMTHIKGTSMIHVKSSSALRLAASASCMSLLPPDTLYPDIEIPSSTDTDFLPEEFPKIGHPANRAGWCYNSQRIKWIARFKRLAAISKRQKQVDLTSSSFFLPSSSFNNQ